MENIIRNLPLKVFAPHMNTVFFRGDFLCVANKSGVLLESEPLPKKTEIAMTRWIDYRDKKRGGCDDTK